ncbi:hypothetical protein RB200_04395 [Streptomyces sp. PmtG]
MESDRVCSVPRNDPRNQAMQPKPRQVEWAVDQAIRGKLNQHISRPANWKNLGMPAYQPQTLFPTPTLEGGGTVPAQVMLGVTAQESNMWQAARSAVPGVTGNPLIGNYYGIDYYDGDSGNDWDVDWSKADCGYGITQVTDHMRLAGREHGHGGAAWDYQKQRAVALDYTANVAAGLRILADKWNETKRAGIAIHDGDPKRLENWFFVLWAYNSGFHANTNGNGPWGLGWTNNPANPEWDAGRSPFMEDEVGNDDARDAAHPQDWPYPEKVLGFAAHPPAFLEAPGKMVPAFINASWNGANGDSTVEGSAKYHRAKVKPPEDLFCGPYNNCDPSKIGDGAQNEAGKGPCLLTSGENKFKCWWHQSVQWKNDCKYSCGIDFTRFPVDWAEEPDGTAYPPNCTTAGLPTGALVIDDLPQGTPSVRPNCLNGGWNNEGTFSIDFGTGESGLGHDGVSTTVWPSKVDLHQIGGGFGGHFYFGHSRSDDLKGHRLNFTAKWKLNKKLEGPAKVMVHLPDHGAQTNFADYEITTAHGKRVRKIEQEGEDKNRWVTLGTFMFDNVPQVKLDTITPTGTGDRDIAFDAVAVVPVKGKWVRHTFDAVSTIDPQENLDTNTPSQVNTPIRNRKTLYDWARNKTVGGAPWNDSSKPRVKGLTEFPACPSGTTKSDCLGPKTLAAMEKWSNEVAEAGTSLEGKTQAQWMGFTNPTPSATEKPSSAFASDFDYKAKTHMDVGFLVGDDGKIIPDSQDFNVTWRAGNTHLAPFLINFVKAVREDYGVAVPDLSHTALDANTVTGKETFVRNPLDEGWTPARSYLPHYSTPKIDDSGKCLNTKAIGGSVDGYRPLGGQADTRKVKVWVDTLQGKADRGDLPQAVADTAGDFYNMFFRTLNIEKLEGTLLQAAPPIWHNVSIAFCQDGSIKPNQAVTNPDNTPHHGLVYQGYMPDLCLYHNDRMVNQSGDAASGPVQRGDFANFSNIPGLTSIKGNAYGKCDIAERGNGGNPWNISVPPLTGTNETPKRVIYCDDKTSHSSTEPDGD